MKKFNGATVCYGLSLLLFVAFVVHTIVDYSRYNTTLNSAPFYVWIFVNAVYFVLPAILLLLIGFVIRKKSKTA